MSERPRRDPPRQREASQRRTDRTVWNGRGTTMAEPNNGFEPWTNLIEKIISSWAVLLRAAVLVLLYPPAIMASSDVVRGWPAPPGPAEGQLADVGSRIRRSGASSTGSSGGGVGVWMVMATPDVRRVAGRFGAGCARGS